MTSGTWTGKGGTQVALIPVSHLRTSTVRARELQGVYDDREARLTALARAGGPARLHWWGIRQRGRDAMAWCYLCDQAVARWSGRFDPAPRSVLSIQHHRAWHLGEADHK